MTRDDTLWQFTPYWMHGLDQDKRQEVQDWLVKSGVNLRLCPGFNFAPTRGTIWTRYYKTTDQGELRWSMENRAPMYEEHPRNFIAATPIPKSVTESFSG